MKEIISISKGLSDIYKSIQILNRLSSVSISEEEFPVIAFGISLTACKESLTGFSESFLNRVCDIDIWTNDVTKFLNSSIFLNWIFDSYKELKLISEDERRYYTDTVQYVRVLSDMITDLRVSCRRYCLVHIKDFKYLSTEERDKIMNAMLNQTLKKRLYTDSVKVKLKEKENADG